MTGRISIYFIVLTIGFYPMFLFPGNVSITKVGEWGTGPYFDVFVQGNYAYCAAVEVGLDIIDVTNPSNPRKVGNVNTGLAHQVYLIGNYAYVIDRASGDVQVVNITNPFSPVLKGSSTIFKDVSGMAVKGNYAYVTANGIFKIVDVSTPSSPTLVADYEITPCQEGIYFHDTMDVFVKGNYAYIAVEEQFHDGDYCVMVIIDISNPLAPKRISAFISQSFENSSKVYVQGNYAYLASFRGLIVVDVSNPFDPKEVGSIKVDYYFNGYYDIHVNGDYAYIASAEKGMQVLRVSDPASPTPVANYEIFGWGRRLYFFGNHVYLAAQEGGLQIFDVSQPTSPTLAGAYNQSGKAMGLDIAGNYVYLAHFRGGLQAVDVSQPSSPKGKGIIEADNINRVFTSGHYVYARDVYANLKIIDVSNLSSPQLKATYDPDSMIYGVQVSGNYAYVVTSGDGLNIIDVSNPSSPNLLGTFESDLGQEVFVRGNLAYFSVMFYGLQIVDVSNPASPALVGENTTLKGLSAIDVNGNYAYLVGSSNSLQIIDVSDPTSPNPVGAYYTSRCYDVAVSGNYAYLAGASDGLLVIDVSDPTSPTLAGNYNTPGEALEVKADGNYIYVADGPTGKLLILEISESSAAPRISLNRSKLSFASTTIDPGINTGTQSLLIGNSGGGTLNWSVSVDRDWLNCLPASGTGNGEVWVSVNTTGLAAGTYSGTITITDGNAVNSPQSAAVTLKVYKPNETSKPFGVFATPIDASTVSGSIPVTGWVLDDIGVQGVSISREEGKNLVFIGDAVFVEGARPDVEQAYPGYPMNYKAGWGYMMLTNFLPNSGNGTFKIHAIATDVEGNQVTLGIKTIIVDNANAVKPFGAIDTPTQGGPASGSDFINFGWALTPPPNAIPLDGSTIRVWVDGVSLGNPVYNNYREDIAALFPGYNNSDGAGGYFYLDTTQYENGVHTIQWTVTDDAGNTDGIGSRYFTIKNGSQSTKRKAQSAWRKAQRAPDISKIPIDYSRPLRVKKGYNRDVESQTFYPDKTGQITIDIKELERVEIRLSEGTRGLAPLSNAPLSNAPLSNGNKFTNKHWIGFQVIGSQLRSLPIGSFLDHETGIFSWTPGPGHFGLYTLLFIKGVAPPTYYCGGSGKKHMEEKVCQKNKVSEGINKKGAESPGEGKKYHIQIKILPR
jgi:hypothetical protein